MLLLPVARMRNSISGSHGVLCNDVWDLSGWYCVYLARIRVPSMHMLPIPGGADRGRLAPVAWAAGRGILNALTTQGRVSSRRAIIPRLAPVAY